MQGNYHLKDQIDSSHVFLYGHRYWPHVKQTVQQHAREFSPNETVKLSDQILSVAQKAAKQARVDESLTIGITAKAASTNNATASSTSGAKKLGDKQVVLEYDTQAREGKAVVSAPQSDQAAIQKARSAYASGNQRLFAGDAGGAIKFYRQSLGFYPGYVAGYRGLGLAYAQQGDKGKA
jgi:hypothetical protein